MASFGPERNLAKRLDTATGDMFWWEKLKAARDAAFFGGKKRDAEWKLYGV